MRRRLAATLGRGRDHRRRLKDALYASEGLFTRYSHKVMALSDWERMSKRMDTLAKAGVNSYGHV